MRKNDIIKISINNSCRLYVIISPEEMNEALNTLIVCPLVNTKRNVPTQTLIKANVKSNLPCDCFLAVDQITTIEKDKVMAKVGEISETETQRASIILQEMFAI